MLVYAFVQFFDQVFELSFVLYQPANLICASLKSFFELVIFLIDNLLTLLGLENFLTSILEL